VAREVPAVLEESIARMGTTFSTYRTIWNEPGAYGEQLLVYDRAGEPCRHCGTPLKRIVQNGRSTYFCPSCQRREVSSNGARKLARPGAGAARRAGALARRGGRKGARRLSNH
jgi:hypothetical protein